MYKFINLTEKIKLSNTEKRFIKRLNKINPNVWDRSIAKIPKFKRGQEKKRGLLKDSIRNRLKKLQGEFCIYCGSLFDSATETHVEHIIPKNPHYNFTFEPYNLVLACQRCNMDMKRTGSYLVKNKISHIYKNCSFNIVHPYFDDLDLHINHARIILISNTIKGQKTISEFDLNEEKLLIKRGMFLQFQGITLTKYEQSLINDIITRNYH